MNSCVPLILLVLAVVLEKLGMQAPTIYLACLAAVYSAKSMELFR